MRILFAASEAHPFIKSGGLGDVIGALPKELKNLDVDARVIIPRYKNIRKDLFENMVYIRSFNVPVGWRNQNCNVFEYTYDNVIYYFIDNNYYFDRNEMYGHIDDGERFAFFSRAVLNFLRESGWCPNIIHCNDWQTGMIPVMLKVEYYKESFYSNIKTVFSIHNLLFQGNYVPSVLPELFGYDYGLYDNMSLELNGNVSFMKGGINFSDKVSTVSKTYAEEIKTKEYGENLEGLLSYRSNDLIGIVNGIDYNEYNPENDMHICKKYGIYNLQDKLENKKDLQRSLGLPVNENIPVISIVSRLTNQKGIDLIINSIEQILQRGAQLIVLGTGEEKYENYFRYLQDKYRDRVSANIQFDNGLAHRIYAGSDIFLMPSMFEPCGLGQLIALRYGTIPLVRETGGLKDTVIPYNETTGIGTGFSFREYRQEDLSLIMNYALDVYYNNKEAWYSLVNQAISSDNSWSKSANEYKNLYERIIWG
ncbi:MAG: glycogen synthase GlgA [Clostridium perfringens]|nr:glycogen synthase GlgA [Clostridium perfringens]